MRTARFLQSQTIPNCINIFQILQLFFFLKTALDIRDSGAGTIRLAAGHIVRTPHSTLSARRTAHCPHAAQHIVRTPHSTLAALRHGRCGTRGGRPYTEESPSIHSGMAAAAHRADGLIQRNRLQLTPAWPLRHTGRTALYRGIAFNSLRHGRCGTQGGRVTDLFC